MRPLAILYTGQYWLPQTRFFYTFNTAGYDVLGVVWLIKLDYTSIESKMIHYPRDRTAKLVIRFVGTAF